MAEIRLSDAGIGRVMDSATQILVAWAGTQGKGLDESKIEMVFTEVEKNYIALLSRSKASKKES